MDILLKISVVFLILFLIAMQVLIISPISAGISAGEYDGDPLKSYQTTIRDGFVTLDVLGDYVADSALLMINGVYVKDIDHFPVTIRLANGDVVEIYTRKGTAPFYVYVSERSPALDTGQDESSIKVCPGVSRILKAVIGGGGD